MVVSPFQVGVSRSIAHLVGTDQRRLGTSLGQQEPQRGTRFRFCHASIVSQLLCYTGSIVLSINTRTPTHQGNTQFLTRGCT